MRIFNKMLEHLVIEDLLGSPNWESTWWTDVVFRGLQEDGCNELGVEPESAGTEIKNAELL